MISNFRKIRRDGRVLLESDSLPLNWEPNKIVTVQWNNGSKLITINEPYGVHANIINDRKMVVLLSYKDECDTNSTLSIVNDDGSTHLVLPNSQKINGNIEQGRFRWFENCDGWSENYFVFVFEALKNSELFSNPLYRMVINAENGSIEEVRLTR
jgi:hypothetical protein